MIKNKIQHIRLGILEIKSQKEFAKLVEVDPSKISKWENQKEQPETNTAFKISRKIKEKRGIEIKVDDMFEYTPD